jgi:hypothetical protein
MSKAQPTKQTAIGAAANAVGKTLNIPEPFRAVAVNFTGNVGKTTLMRHVFMPVLPDVNLISVETINSSGAIEAAAVVNGGEFEEVAKQFFEADGHILADIGASNIERVKAALHRLGDAHEDVDMWVVPCTPGSPKIVKDTIETMKELCKLGVNPQTIVVLKNKVVEVEKMDDDFAELTAAAKVLGVRLIDRPVLAFDLYSTMDNRPGSMDSLVLDSTNYRQLMREKKRAGDSAGAEEAVEAEFRRKNARQAQTNLAALREDIFGLV